MGDILLVYDVTVEDQDTLDRVEADCKKINIGKLQKVERVPFVFGTQAIRVAVIVPDKTDGMSDAVEEYFNGIEGVSSINNVATTLI
jgi:translation elongation factor EF-1beta